jgi:hypothetical protein
VRDGAPSSPHAAAQLVRSVLEARCEAPFDGASPSSQAQAAGLPVMLPGAGDVEAALLAAVVTFALYALIAIYQAKAVDWREARLWALGTGLSRYFIGV